MATFICLACSSSSTDRTDAVATAGQGGHTNAQSQGGTPGSSGASTQGGQAGSTIQPLGGQFGNAGTSSLGGQAGSSIVGTPKPVDAQTLDTIIFGNSVSETAHSLVTGFFAPQATIEPLPSEPSNGAASDTATGQFNLSSRRLLPRTPNADYYGGEAGFTMAVDPEKLNYFTLKTWGSDKSPPWLVLDVQGMELGWRHGGSDEIIFHQTTGWYPGAFAYRTMRLPYHVTHGKTKVSIKLRSIGEIAYYANNTYNERQQRMAAPTVPLYAAYTHTGAQLDVSGEQQGTASAGIDRPAENGDSFLTGWKSRVNNKVNKALTNAVGSLTPMQLQLLAQSFTVDWSAGYQSATVLSQVRDGMDAMTRAYAAAPTTYVGSHGNDSWGGWFGEAGEAIRLLKTQLSADLDTAVDYGGSIGSTTRRVAWATALRAGVDYGRMNRQSVTNQAFWGAWRIYVGNRALLELQPSMALKDAEARRYLYEASGVSPWLGNDQTGDGDTPIRGTAPMGPDWYMVTSDGTSKEDCLVGGDYGELGGIVMRWALDTGDAQLKAQSLKMLRARAALRYPAPDMNGQRAFVVAEAIGCRNSQEMNQHVAYLGRAEVEDLLVASLGPTEVGSDLVGYAQQAMAEGNLLSRMGPDDSYASIRVPEYYAKFKALAATGVKLPMGNDQPDFAWVDRENMAIAAKAGSERFWAVLNWHNAQGLNRLARVFVTTPQNAFTAEVGIEDIQYTPAGRSLVAGVGVDAYNPPPDNPTNVDNTLIYPAAMRADLTSEPSTNRDVGRADAYTLRYGRWLVGLNAHPTRSYQVKVPVGFTSAVDLASGKTYSGTVTVAPRSYVVLRLPSVTAAAVSPSNPLQPVAISTGTGSVIIGWEHTSGASGYVVSRADAIAGPFVEVSHTTSSTSWTNVGVGSGYYLVQAVDAYGNRSGPSLTVSPIPSAALGTALDSNWSSADIGSVAATGSATVSGSSITLTSAGRDIWGTADGLRYAYQPLADNARITVHVASQTLTHQWARAGVMLRESLVPGARQASVLVTGSNGVELNWRDTPDRNTRKQSLAGYAAPTWLRLTREGGVLTGEVSTDGSSWTRVGQSTIGLAPLVFVGLAATSVTTDGSMSTVVFDSVDIRTLP